MQAQLTESQRPILIPTEIVLREQAQVEVYPNKDKMIGTFTLYVTSHRLIFVENHQGFCIPYHYFGSHKTSGGLLRAARIEFSVVNASSLPQYYIELGQMENMPVSNPPRLPGSYLLKFRAEGRDATISQIESALKAKTWLKSILPPKKEIVAKQNTGFGISSIKNTIKQDSKQTDSTLSAGFQDLRSLFDNSKELAELASKLKQVDESKDPELLEIKNTMASLGFTSGVTKESSGNNFHVQLAREICDYIRPHLEENGGVLPILDAYCMYNRARGGDLISPNDMKRACELMESLRLPIQVKTLPSGVIVMQLGGESIERLISLSIEKINTSEHLSAKELAELLGINALIAKQCLIEAENRGLLCRDQSIQGLHFYMNILDF